MSVQIEQKKNSHQKQMETSKSSWLHKLQESKNPKVFKLNAVTSGNVKILLHYQWIFLTYDSRLVSIFTRLQINVYQENYT